jgi:hypothetical protein
VGIREVIQVRLTTDTWTQDGRSVGAGAPVERLTDNNLGASTRYGGLARARAGIRTSAGMGEGEESNIYSRCITYTWPYCR